MRKLVLVAVFLLGVYADRNLFGGIMALTIFGLCCIVIYTALDIWHGVQDAVGPKSYTEVTQQNLHVHTGDTMPGHPTSQEWGAITELGRRYRDGQSQGRKEW